MYLSDKITALHAEFFPNSVCRLLANKCVIVIFLLNQIQVCMQEPLPTNADAWKDVSFLRLAC